MVTAILDSPRPIAPSRPSVFHEGVLVPQFEVVIERAPQGTRRCRQCAAVQGRYLCLPAEDCHDMWQCGEPGLEVIVQLVGGQNGAVRRLQVMIVVKRGRGMHARLVYNGDPALGEIDGPWTLNLISEQMDCGFAFPNQIELRSIGPLAVLSRGERVRALVSSSQ